MSYMKLAEKGVVPFVDAMIQQKALKNNIFAYSLSLKNEETYGFKSDMTLGFYDKSKFLGKIKWFPVQEKHFFSIKLDDILFDGKSYDLCKIKPKGCLMTIDSGLTYMGVPKYLNTVMKQKGIGQSGWCDPKTQLGNITLVIGGEKYHQPPSDWQYTPEWKQTIENGNYVNKLECFSNIMELDVESEMLLVGNRFMRRVYTVYDRDNDRVGLAHSS